MDHLPIPDSCKERAWKVPYLGVVKYDGKGVAGFLERLGTGPEPVLTSCLSADNEIHLRGWSHVQVSVEAHFPRRGELRPAG